ncbi:MAG: hypothetical protein P4L33_17650 [Capsulimonadaceae bacterium]|nr:hypothetical protein [Capsulimonadaceae bacterium]
MQSNSWRQSLAEYLPRLGHRNWIVIADSAYPDQVAGGIETLIAQDDHLSVVAEVLRAVDAAAHVRATVLIDNELDALDDADAPGCAALRAGFSALFAGRETRSLPHEEIIRELDAAGSTFRILVIKTPLTLPYTTVFVRLECGYWNADAEQRLQARLQS